MEYIKLVVLIILIYNSEFLDLFKFAELLLMFERGIFENFERLVYCWERMKESFIFRKIRVSLIQIWVVEKLARSRYS